MQCIPSGIAVFMFEIQTEPSSCGYPLFKYCLPSTSCEIVLSTLSVSIERFKFSKPYLTSDIHLRLIGATFYSRDMPKFASDNMSRGMQGCNDVRRRKPTRWFTTYNDDYACLIEHRANLIKTGNHIRLSDPSVQDAIWNDMIRRE